MSSLFKSLSIVMLLGSSSFASYAQDLQGLVAPSASVLAVDKPQDDQACWSTHSMTLYEWHCGKSADVNDSNPLSVFVLQGVDRVLILANSRVKNTDILFPAVKAKWGDRTYSILNLYSDCRFFAFNGEASKYLDFKVKHSKKGISYSSQIFSNKQMLTASEKNCPALDKSVTSLAPGSGLKFMKGGLAFLDAALNSWHYEVHSTKQDVVQLTLINDDEKKIISPFLIPTQQEVLERGKNKKPNRFNRFAKYVMMQKKDGYELLGLNGIVLPKIARTEINKLIDLQVNSQLTTLNVASPTSQATSSSAQKVNSTASVKLTR